MPERLAEFLEKTVSLRASFSQKVEDSQGVVLQETRGTMVVQRPNRFRWDYDPPAPQLVVSDGESVWVYDSELEQATVKPAEKVLANTPALLFGGRRDAVEQAFYTQKIGKFKGIEWFELRPREKGAMFERIRLGFSRRGIAQMELVDQLGQRTQLSFSDVEQNPRLKPAVFRFSPPAGVDVIREAQ